MKLISKVKVWRTLRRAHRFEGRMWAVLATPQELLLLHEAGHDLLSNTQLWKVREDVRTGREDRMWAYFLRNYRRA